MINIELVKKLIDQIPEIKTLFKTEEFPVASSYDRSLGQRKTTGIPVQTIYKQSEFLDWKNQLCFELKKIEGDSYIDEVVKLLNHFNGWDDESRFEELESKLKVLRDHLEEYSDECSEASIEDK